MLKQCDFQVTWNSVLPQLETDPRFTRSTLPLNHKLHIFHDHIGKLRHKHIQSLHVLFESHTPTLATAFSTLPVDSMLSSLPATKLGFDKRDLEHEFERWQRERNTEARKAFDEMMGENSFIEFWGRLGKIGGAGVDSSIQNDDIGEEEKEDEERVDMKKLAKGVDVKEIVKVLKVWYTYLVFPPNDNPPSLERQALYCFQSCTRAEGEMDKGELTVRYHTHAH